MAETFDYYREGALVPSSADSEGFTGPEEFVPLPGIGYTQPLATYQPPERSDAGIAFSKGKRLLSGSAETLFKGFTGDFLKTLGFEEAGDTWLSDAYQSGILMGIDVNELDSQLKGPKTLEEIEDWKGAIAWGMNAVAEQVPNLVTTFAPAIIGTLILKRPTIGTVGTLGTIDFLNTAEVYTDLLMSTGESRPAVAAATGTLMSTLDMIVPMKVIGRMGKGPDFASWFGGKLKDPKSGFAVGFGKAIGSGVTEGTTEYIQTMMEGMALNYVQEKDLLTEFSEAQRAEQLESGARGALIGTLLGIPISYQGFSARRKAEKFTKQTAQQQILDRLGAQNEVDQQGVSAANPDLQGFQLGELTVTSPTMADLVEQRRIEQQSIFDGPITEEEFNNWVRGGKLSDSRLRKIGEKNIANEELDLFETAIFSAETSRINDIIRQLASEKQAADRFKQATAKTKMSSIQAILSRGNVDVKQLDRLRELPLSTGIGRTYLDNVRRRREEAQRAASETGPITPMQAAERRADESIRQRDVELREGIEERKRVTQPEEIGARVIGPKKRVIGLSFVDDVTQDQALFYGFNVTGNTRVVTRSGRQALSRGKSEQRKVYESEFHVIKKASPEGVAETTLDSTTTTKDAPWVVLDKATGKVIRSVPTGKKGQGEGQTIFPSEFYKEGETNISMLLDQYSQSVVKPAKRERESREDIESRILTQELSKQGAVDANVGDKVRTYDKEKDSYPDDNVYTVTKVTPVRKKKTGERGNRYELAPESGNKFEVSVYPSDPGSLVIVRSFAEVSPERVERITSEDEVLQEELMSPEQAQEFAREAGVTDQRKLPEEAREKPRPREEVAPVGTSILRLDPSTGVRPSPETHRVKLTKEAATKIGLDPEFYYDWESFSFPQWGEQRDDFIKVSGQLVRHVRRKGKPSELQAIRKRPTSVTVSKKDFVDIDPKLLPDTVPNKFDIDQAYIDYKTGVFIVRRKNELDEDGSPKYDESDVEVYLTYNTKEEFQSKTDSVRQFFDEYERISVQREGLKGQDVGATVPAMSRKDQQGRVIKARKTIPLKGGVRTSSIEPSQVISELGKSGTSVQVRVKPLIIAKINRELKASAQKTIEQSALLDVLSSYTKNMVNVSYGGNVRQIKLDSIVDAQVTKFMPDKKGAIDHYMLTLERGSINQEAMLIASFKIDSDTKNVSYEKFQEELFGDTAHRYGMFGVNKDKVRSARENALSKVSGNTAVIHTYGGVEITGTIGSVEDGNLKLYTPRTTKYVLIDLLNIESYQIKKPKSKYVAEQAPIEDIERTGEMFVYFPINPDVVKQEQPVISPEKSVVNVYKRKIIDRYSIFVDDTKEVDGLTLEDTIDYLNNIEKDTNSEVTVGRLPKEIIAEKVERKYRGDRPYVSKLLRARPGRIGAEIEPIIPENVKYVYKKSSGKVSSSISGRVIGRKDLVKKVSTEVSPEVIGKDIDKDSSKEANKILAAVSKPIKKVETTVSKEAVRKSEVADNKTKEAKDYESTPFYNIPEGQKFKDKYGGEWKVMQHVGNTTILQFNGGKAPNLEFQVEWKGKKSKTKFEKGFNVTVRSSSTPSTMAIRTKYEDYETDFVNYSVVAPVPADGTGSIKYNTGLTPKRFREILGSKIGRLNINRLIEKGLIKVVQGQQDMNNAPIDLAVKAVTRNGEVVFITNNIKEEEVVSVFVHEVGVHVGLKEVYGADFGSLIEEVKSRKGAKEWESAFENAEIVADKFSFTDDIARDNFIAEEALAYYVESNNNFKDSFWQSFLDLISRWVARTKMWFGGKLTNDQLVSFARGAVRGMSERNFENAINAVDEEYYSQSEDAFNKVADTFETLGVKFDGATRDQYVGKARALWDKTKVFFDPFARLPFGREFRKLRSLLQGKLGEIEQFGEEVLSAYEGLNEQENQELFDYFTNKDASPETISREDLRAPSVALKNKIMEIADEGVIRGIYPEASQAQMEELRGAYLPRVFLYHILKNSGTRGAGMRSASKRDYATPRIEDMDQDLRELWGEVKDVRYLLYRAVTIPQQDIAIIDFLESVSVQKAFQQTDEAKEIISRMDELKIKRQDENATQEQREELLKEIGVLRKELSTLGKDGKRYVSGNVPWVMPNQWVRVKLKTARGEKVINTTLASINRQITEYQNYLKTATTITDKARSGLLEQVASLDLARKEFLDSVGVDKNLDPNNSRDVDEINKQVLNYYNDNFDIALFQKMPGDVERYGSMANLYVRREIYDDIIGNSDMVTGEQNLFQRMLLPYGKHAQLVSIFKTMKVPLNPPTVVRNFIANLIMMQLFGGVSFRRQPTLIMEALREMRGGEKGTVFTHTADGRQFTAYELAMEQGIGATTLTNAELRKLEKVFSFMERDGVWGLVTKGQNLWNQIADFGSNLYQGIETLGKVAVINDMLQNQRAELESILSKSESTTLTIEDIAVQEANRVLFDYSEVHPTVRGLRSSFLGAPFITYQVKVMPQLAKIISDPSKWHRFLPYVMMIGSMQALFGSIPFMDDDWDKMQELLPEWTKDNTMVFLPWKDSNGNWQAVDLSYFFPWTWYMQTGGNIMKGELAKAAVEGGIVGPGWQIMTTFLTGKDPWSGYQIINKNDATSDKFFDIMSYANSMIMPPWLTRNGIVSVSSLAEAMGRLDPSELEGKLPDLILGRTNRYGEPKRSAMGVIGSAVGLTTYAVSPQARTIENKRYASEIRGLKSDITFAKKNRRLSPSEKKRTVNALRDRIDEVRKERAEYNKKTSGIERAL